MNDYLKSYFGTLDPAELAEGIAAAQANALRLIEDAKILADAGRFPSAAALAILAVEERGKAIVLKRMAIVPDDKVKDTWRDYRNHRAKNAGWAMPLLMADGARTMKDFAPMIDKKAGHAVMLDALKQVAFYTDCLGKKHWSKPEEVIEPDLAKVLIEIAERMWGDKAVTARELEVWHEVVAPHYGKPEMGEAVIRCEEQLVKEGLRETPIESLRAFLEGRPVAVEKREPKPASESNGASEAE